MKSQVPKASSRDKLERVKAKLSVVTLLLPKMHLRSGIITHESDNDDDSGNEEKTADVPAIDKVAAAQNSFATSSNDNSNRKPPDEKSIKSVGFQVASPPISRRKGVVSAPKTSLVKSTDEQSKNLKNVIEWKRKLSSEPRVIQRTSSETNLVDDVQLRKLSNTTMVLPRRLQKRMTLDYRDKSSNMLPLPTVEEENSSSSSVKNLDTASVHTILD